MTTAKKKPASAKPSAAASASASSTTTGVSATGNKKKPPPSAAAAAAAAPTAVAAAPSDKTNTTAKKEKKKAASSPSSLPEEDDDNDESQMTRCTEKDVLLGRGKRVSEWPGNIHFRQIVNRYREEYATAERANKVKIAAAVIAAVQNVGGRYLREGTSAATGKRAWYVVSHDRAVEKTCQALREKEKANPPTVSPFVGGDNLDDDDFAVGSPLRQKRSRLSPTGSPSDGGSAPRTKRKILHQTAAETSSDEDEETSSDNDDDDDDDSRDSDDDDADSAATSEEHAEGEGRNISGANTSKPSPAAAAAAATAAASMAASTAQAKLRIKGNNVSKKPPSGASSPVAAVASPEEVARVMMNRLRSFWSMHGHAAVPPIWPRDQKLADWCIEQRQLHREIVSAVVPNSSKRPNQENPQQSSTDENIPLDRYSSGGQKVLENGASEQNGAANEEEEEKKKMNAAADKGEVGDSMTAAAEEKTATTTSSPATATDPTATSHFKIDRQQAEPYRRGTPAEVRRIEALNRLGFCWDYAAWHWEHQYQLLLAQIAPVKHDETQQAVATLNKTTRGNKSDDTAEKQNGAMEVDGAPAKKDDAERMDVDKESPTISNAKSTEAKKPEDGNAMKIDQQDEGKTGTALTEETPEAAATASAAASHNNQHEGVKDGIFSTILTDGTLEWLDDQQDQYHNQGHHLVSKERRDKLEAMGIYF